MRHLLVSFRDPATVDALRDAAGPSMTFLEEPELEEALERLSRSSRFDGVITDDPELLAAIRSEIPGSIPVHVAADGEGPGETIQALERLLGE